MKKNILRRVSDKLSELAVKCGELYEAWKVGRLCNGRRMMRFAEDMRRKAVKYSAAMTPQQLVEMRIVQEEMDEAITRSFKRRQGLVECGKCHWVGEIVEMKRDIPAGGLFPTDVCATTGCNGSCRAVGDLANI